MPVFENVVEWQQKRYSAAMLVKFGKDAVAKAKKRCQEECSRTSWHRRCSNLPLEEDGSFCKSFKHKEHRSYSY